MIHVENDQGMGFEPGKEAARKIKEAIRGGKKEEMRYSASGRQPGKRKEAV